MVSVCYTNVFCYQSINESYIVVQTDFALLQRAPLHIAAEKGHDHSVLHLADNGADVNIRNANGVSNEFINF